jgi:1,5-anhydro-D-fructose reductase (1,5-anhydro-D-mannitol-forming)
VLGTGLWCFAGFESADRVTLTGTAGKVSFAVFENEPVTLETAAGRQTFDIPHPPHIQQPLIQQIVDELRGVGQCVSTGETALRTTAVMDRILAEYYQK